jgi:hypothetical protein
MQLSNIFKRHRHTYFSNPIVALLICLMLALVFTNHSQTEQSSETQSFVIFSAPSLENTVSNFDEFEPNDKNTIVVHSTDIIFGASSKGLCNYVQAHCFDNPHYLAPFARAPPIANT